MSFMKESSSIQPVQVLLVSSQVKWGPLPDIAGPRENPLSRREILLTTSAFPGFPNWALADRGVGARPEFRAVLATRISGVPGDGPLRRQVMSLAGIASVDGGRIFAQKSSA